VHELSRPFWIPLSLRFGNNQNTSHLKNRVRLGRSHNVSLPVAASQGASSLVAGPDGSSRSISWVAVVVPMCFAHPGMYLDRPDVQADLTQCVWLLRLGLNSRFPC